MTYHNYRHAFDVTQMAYYFITQTNAGEIMDNMDIFLLLVCCVGHDADHYTSPGGPKTWVGEYPQEPRPCLLMVKAAPRSAQVYMKVEEVANVHDFSAGLSTS